MTNPKDNKPDALGTKIAHKSAIAALKDCDANAATEDYLSILSENLEKFRIKDVGENLDDVVVKSIDDFAPYRDEAVGLFAAVARYAPTDDNIRRLHRFFESLTPYMNPPANVGRYNVNEFDNFKFIIRELFLCWIAALLQRERFAEADAFLREQFYLGLNASGEASIKDYFIFDPTMQSLERINQRKGVPSFEADLFKARANSSAREFCHLMQADFVLYIRGWILHPNPVPHSWYPITLVGTDLNLFPRAFEIFARSASTKYFESSKQILGISQKEDLPKAMQRFEQVKWNKRAIDPKALLGYEQLATLP